MGEDILEERWKIIGERALIVTLELNKQSKKTKFKKQINDGDTVFLDKL